MLSMKERVLAKTKKEEAMKVIKTEKDYDVALERASALMEIDPDPGTQEADELEVLAVLIEKYETEKYKIELPNSIEAIKFEMDQRGLSKRDLIPFIGSRGKVSDVLNGNTSLSLKMIRSLHKGLGIPAEILLQEKDANLPDEIQWEKYPFKEMFKRGYFSEVFEGDFKEGKEKGEELVHAFISTSALPQDQVIMLRRKRSNLRGSSKNDVYALSAWQMRIWSLANKVKLAKTVEFKELDDSWFDYLLGLSRLPNSPLLARDYLADSGIIMIVLKHLPKTYLDGAALKRKDGKPVVALTLRYDRLDYFWFTLVHELMHIKEHIQAENDPGWYLDDLEIEGNEQEKEADRLTMNALIPQKYSTDLDHLQSTADVRQVAKQINRNPAIVAGRLRKKRSNYRIFSSLVGHRELRGLFPEF